MRLEELDDIHELLIRIERMEGKQFNEKERETLHLIIRTFEDNRPEIASILRREQVSKLYAELQLRIYSIIKWALASFLTVVGILEGWDRVLYPFLKRLFP